MVKRGLRIKIESDFRDYYDYLNEEKHFRGVYKRFRCVDSRAGLLNILRRYGIRTIDLKSVRDFSNDTDKVVVYTNPKLHNFEGKKIIRLAEAKILYPNYVASKFYDEAKGETLKYLQVGDKRFRLMMKNRNTERVDEGVVMNIVELAPEPSTYISDPIFSIDYISNGKEMVAIDFNRAQELGKLGFRSIMSPESVMLEVKKVLERYNKII